jgi:PAS domain S-box-containing protein
VPVVDADRAGTTGSMTVAPGSPPGAAPVIAERRLDALRALDRATLATSTPEELADLAVLGIHGLVPADHVAVWIGDLTLGRGRRVSSRGARPTGRPSDVALDASADVLAALARPDPIHVPDLARLDALAPRPGRLARRGARSWCVVPLVDAIGPIGAIAMDARVPGAFDAGALVVAREIGDRLAIALRQGALRDRLDRSTAFVERLADAAPSATLIVSLDGRIRHANAAAEGMFGRPPQELAGASSASLLPEAPWVVDGPRLVRGPATDPGGQAAVDGVRTDGSRFRADVRWAAVELPDGPGALLHILDLDAQRELESHLLQVQKLGMLGEVTGIMAHDFRNYLTAIGGFARLLAADGERVVAEDEDVRGILSTVDHADAAIASMLAFARPDPGQDAATDLDAHLRGSLPLLQKVASPRCRVEVEIAPGLPAVAMAPAALTQVLMNLVANARDAMAGGGIVRIRAIPADPSGRARRSTDAVVLEVRDTGGGMDAATKERMFEPFFTTKASGADSISGSGLGLPSVRLIVGRARGRIEVDSEPGRGTSIRLALPVAVGDQAREPGLA